MPEQIFPNKSFKQIRTSEVSEVNIIQNKDCKKMVWSQ